MTDTGKPRTGAVRITVELTDCPRADPRRIRVEVHEETLKIPVIAYVPGSVPLTPRRSEED